jgi:glyoxylate reductase
MPRVVVTRPLPGRAVEMLAEGLGEAQVWVHEEDAPIPRDTLLNTIPGAEAVLSLLTERVDAAFFDAAGPGLRIVANMAVGYDNIDVAEATRRGVPVSNTPDVLTETTADLAFGLILAAARRFSESERFLRSGQWGTWSPTLLLGVDVHGKTLGIYGMGRIGQAVARRARGFAMPVRYHNRTRLPDALERELGATWVDFPTLLAESDVLSLHCPLSAETRHRFGAAEFRAMKPAAVLVNTTRGPVVDEAALAAALRAGEIFAAGLDVFEKEPAVHPGLLACDNVVLIPHLGSATRDTRAAMAELAARNILDRLQGRRPPTCVNPETLD